MSLRILSIDEVNVVGSNDLYIVFLGKFPDALYYQLLFGKNAAVSFRIVSLMPLYLKVKVIAEQIDVFLKRFFCRSHRSIEYLIRDLSCKACRRCNKSLPVLSQHFLVDAGSVIKTLYPGQ